MPKTKTEKRVKCPNCGGIYFRTTKTYRVRETANAGMIEMLEPWKGWGWGNGIQDETNGYGDMACPGCGNMLAPDGKLSVIEVEIYG